MADYSKFVALAQRLIAKRGRAVTLQQQAKGGDAAKPWKAGTPGVVQADAAYAVFLDPTGSDVKTVVTDTELLKRVTDVALVAPGTMDYSGMTHMMDGKLLRIEWVKTLKPGDTVCLYIIGVTR